MHAMGLGWPIFKGFSQRWFSLASIFAFCARFRSGRPIFLAEMFLNQKQVGFLGTPYLDLFNVFFLLSNPVHHHQTTSWDDMFYFFQPPKQQI